MPLIDKRLASKYQRWIGVVGRVAPAENTAFSHAEQGRFVPGGLAAGGPVCRLEREDGEARI